MWLRKHEEKYLTHDLDLANVVHTLKVWRYYLMKKRCELYMDHTSLKLCKEFNKLNLRIVANMEVTEMEVNFALLLDAGQRPLMVASRRLHSRARGFTKNNLIILFGASMAWFACYWSHGQGRRPRSTNVVDEGMVEKEGQRSH
jgi:hypothetical protein